MAKFNLENFLTEIENTKDNSDSGFSKFEKQFISFISEYVGTKVIEDTGGSGDKGIDAVYYVEGTNKLTLFQFKMKKPSNKLMQDELDGIVIKVNKFISNCHNMNLADGTLSKVANLIINDMVREIELIICTTGSSMNGLNSNNSSVIQIGDKNVLFKYKTFDKHSLLDMVRDMRSNRRFHENVDGKSMQFELVDGGYIVHSIGEAYTLKVNALDLYEKAFQLIGQNSENISSLTHKNVRDFLGTNEKEDGNISKGIRNTITDKLDAKNTYAYHMGLVVLCEKISIHGKNIQVLSPSFVNGAQTLGTLLKTRKMEISPEAHFTIRFIQTPNSDISEKAKDFADRVVIRTNSSNPITDAMKYAFDPRQKMIARLFEERGYYYDYRAAESDVVDIYKKAAKMLEDKISFNSSYNSKLFWKNVTVKPDEVAHSIYAIQHSKDGDYWTPRIDKVIFRYTSNQNAEYTRVFYDEGKVRSFDEYFVPLALHNVFLMQMKSIFTYEGDIVTKNYKTKQYKLSFDEARKIQWIIFMDFLKEKNILSIDDAIRYLAVEKNGNFDEIRLDMKNYLNALNDDLSEKGTEKTRIKKILVGSKKDNLADIARTKRQ